MASKIIRWFSVTFSVTFLVTFSVTSFSVTLSVTFPPVFLPSSGTILSALAVLFCSEQLTFQYPPLLEPIRSISPLALSFERFPRIFTAEIPAYHNVTRYQRRHNRYQKKHYRMQMAFHQFYIITDSSPYKGKNRNPYCRPNPSIKEKSKKIHFCKTGGKRYIPSYHRN